MGMGIILVVGMPCGHDSLLWPGFPYRVTLPAVVESHVGHASGRGESFLPFVSGGKSSCLRLGSSHHTPGMKYAS